MMLKTFILVLNLSRKCCTSSLLIFLLKLLVLCIIRNIINRFSWKPAIAFYYKIKSWKTSVTVSTMYYTSVYQYNIYLLGWQILLKTAKHRPTQPVLISILHYLFAFPSKNSNNSQLDIWITHKCSQPIIIIQHANSL